MAKNKNMKNVEGDMKNKEGCVHCEGCVFLKVDIHCEGCGVVKIIKSDPSFEGIEKLVIGKLKKLISPYCKKEKSQNEKKSKGDDDKSKENENVEGDMNKEGILSVVFKVAFHCEVCASKISKVVRKFKGVEKAAYNYDANMLRVLGKVDPLKLKKKMERKLNMPVQLISTEKMPPVTTAVLKMPLRCQGCVEKMKNIITQNKGYKKIKIDHEKDLVTVTGSIDVKELVEELKKELKKDVEIVPPYVEGGEKKDGGDGKGEDGQGSGDGGDNKVVGNGMHDQFGYSCIEQIFSDENPNACSIL